MPEVTAKRHGEEGFDNYVRKFARTIGLSSGNERVMWDGNTVHYDGWLTGDEDISVVSDSIEDAPGGTGVQYVQFKGQGIDGIEKTYYVLLNGTTPVLLSATDPTVKFNTIYTAQCLNTEGTNLYPTADQGAANAGTITISGASSGKTMAIIKPNRGRTQMMLWRCPVDKFGKFRKVDIYPDDNQPFVAKLMGRTDRNSSWICVGEIDCDGFEVAVVHPLPDYVGPGVDLCLVVTAGSAGANCSAQMWIELEDIEEE